MYPVLEKQTTCSIGVRRGDYLQFPQTYPAEDMAYYRKCMRIMERRLRTKDIHYLVISDDTDWCRRHFRGVRFTVVPHTAPLADLYVASLCKHNIISNSTFAQWGALLNNNPSKEVLYPSPWTGIGNRRLDTHGAGMPARWTKVHHYSAAYLYGVLLFLFYGTRKHIMKLYNTLFRR